MLSLLATLTLAAPAGCCTPTLPERTLPLLPPEPWDLTRTLLAREKAWLDRPDGYSVLKTEDLLLLWNDRSDWRAYAQDLVARGSWRRADE